MSVGETKAQKGKVDWPKSPSKWEVRVSLECSSIASSWPHAVALRWLILVRETLTEVTISLKGHSPNNILVSAQPSKGHSSQGYPGMSPHPGTERARQLEAGLRSGSRSFPPCVDSGPGEGTKAAESQRAGRQASENSDMLSPQAAEDSGEEVEPGKAL